MNPLSPEHILDRALLHFIAAGVVMLFATRIYAYVKRHAANIELWETIIVPFSIMLWVTAMREAYDIWNGGVWIKSVFDFISWFVGGVVFGGLMWKTRSKV